MLLPSLKGVEESPPWNPCSPSKMKPTTSLEILLAALHAVVQYSLR
jgi:hypothetical protein